MKKIFLVGTPFCGSTIIGNILNSHPEIFHAGEVDRLRIFSRYSGADANLNVDGCVLCGLHHGTKCPVWDDLPDAPQTLDDAVTVYETLVARGNKQVIVDSSKNVDWLADLHAHGLQDACAVVLSRNPFAFARSHHKAVHDPYWRGIEIWRNIYNHCLRVLIHRGIPFIAIQHSQMLDGPDEFFSRILKFVSLDGPVSCNHYFETEAHAVGGNVGPFIPYKAFDEVKYLEREAHQNRQVGDDEMAEKSMLPTSPFERSDSDWLDALSLAEMDACLSIPGVTDVMSLLGYSPASLVSMKNEWDAVKQPRSTKIVRSLPHEALCAV
jgi:hypothetical protein